MKKKRKRRDRTITIPPQTLCSFAFGNVVIEASNRGFKTAFVKIAIKAVFLFALLFAGCDSPRKPFNNGAAPNALRLDRNLGIQDWPVVIDVD